MVRLTFYFKEGCWLCDTAEEMLNGVMEKYGIEVSKVDITSDKELYELYRFDIPVFEFRDGSALHGRIRKKNLLKKLEENRE
jgi:thiol-disulfide isomerase/thioredoxin